MKLSDETKSVLKNYATINSSVHIKPGNIIETISPAKSLYARYEAPEDFKTAVTVYDLPKFLGAISLFDNPEMDFKSKYVEIVEGTQRIKFAYADPSTIITVPDKKIELPSEEVVFDITANQLQNLMKSLAILSLSEVSIVGSEGKVYMQTANINDPTTNSYRVELGTCQEEFNAIFNAANMRFIPRDYKVALSFKKLARFTGGNISYFIPAERNSKFGAS